MYPDADTDKRVIQETTYYVILLPVIRLTKPLQKSMSLLILDNIVSQTWSL